LKRRWEHVESERQQSHFIQRTQDFDCHPNNNLINMLIDPNLIANVILICRLFDIKGLGGFH
jgi:hypothetical protein